MLKAVLFDLDGTLLNTSPDIHKVLNEALLHNDCNAVTLSDTVRWIGGGARKLVERATADLAKEKREQVYATFLRLYAQNDNNLTSLYEGEAQLLYELKERSVKLAIVTNKPQAATDSVTKKWLAPFGFDMVLGESPRFPVKPNPQSCEYVMEELGVSPDECVFVGDGETDVLTAINSHIEGIAVLWGYRSKQQLKESGATKFVVNYEELRKALSEKI